MTVNEIISRLTLEEKALLLQGKTMWTTWDNPRMSIPSIFLADGPHGMRKQAGAGDHLGLNASLPATCFPTAATMANSWDLALGEALGAALGEEGAAQRVHVVLGPGVNMKRSPLCGRNFEYFSEDPYLAGKMAAAYIRGIQQSGPSACPKHFAVNSQEARRMAMDAVLDERTLREIYLTGFEIAVREGHPRSIMTSYNMVNGVYANENAHLLTDILRREWGFEGFVMTDWGADNDHTEGVRAGSELVMPLPGIDAAIGLAEDVRAGKIDESVLDERVRTLLENVLTLHARVEKTPASFDVDAHHALARKCAAESIVLLENDGTLPLKRGTKVALIGDFAMKPRYQGAGSSMVNPTKMDSMADCISGSGLDVIGTARGYVRTGAKAPEGLIGEAVALAQRADVALICMGLDEISESEGLDRVHMELPQSQKDLLAALHAAGVKVVLVISGGAPFVMPEKETYCAAIHGYLGGQAGAGAMIDALTGKVNPSGKLTESWPMSLQDTPAAAYYPARERTSEYREGLFIGYRYYDTAKVPVRYPFGYGLSYTSFAYSDLEATDKAVSFTIANTGSVPGSEVAQVYVGCKNGKVFRPLKELKGFAKVHLAPGESRRVTVALDDKAFRYFNVKTNAWEVETADYEIYVAASCEDVRLSATVHVEGTQAPLPYGELPSYESGRIADVSDGEFEALLGHPIPDGHWAGEIKLNDALCQLYYAKSGLARLLYRIQTGIVDRANAKGVPNLSVLFFYNMPIRGMSKMSGGMISRAMAKDVAFMVNGHVWRGAGRFAADFVRAQNQKRKFLKVVKNAGK